MTIIYKSKTGHTRRYAEMLAKETHLKVYSLDEAPAALTDSVLFFGWMMAGHISGIDKAVRRYDVKAACGVGMSLYSEKLLADMAKTNYLPSGTLFYLQGGWSPREAGWLNRRMVNMVTRSQRLALEKKKDRTTEEQRMLDMLCRGGDMVEFRNLKPIMDWLAGQV